jgi:2-oxo-4-hydroxy-4-carboxy-5-ureidoimidazoline decarboxylase
MSADRMNINAVNAMPAADFVAAFGEIAEHSPWVAEAAARTRPYASRDAMVEAFQRAVLDAGESARLRLLEAHPDLAGKAAIGGQLTADSRKEQAGAGLDRLTPEEFTRFHALNFAYRVRFEIPFIYAVRGATKQQILQAFEARANGTLLEERLTALAQVLRIIRFRLEDRVEGP